MLGVVLCSVLLGGERNAMPCNAIMRHGLHYGVHTVHN
jgi:hypothetical protein